MLFLLVSVFILPKIIAWDAAQPSALLVFYIVLLGLTLLPFYTLRRMYRALKHNNQRPMRNVMFFALSGLFLLPALILLALVHDGPALASPTADIVLFGIPGVLCIVMSVLLALQGIKARRTIR